jgi:hypothetical protein
MDMPMILPRNIFRWRVTFRPSNEIPRPTRVFTLEILARTQVDAEILGSGYLNRRYGGLWVVKTHHGWGAAPEVVYEAPEKMDTATINIVNEGLCSSSHPCAECSEDEDEPLRDVVECGTCGADLLDHPDVVKKHMDWHNSLTYVIHNVVPDRRPLRQRFVDYL